MLAAAEKSCRAAHLKAFYLTIASRSAIIHRMEKIIDKKPLGVIDAIAGQSRLAFTLVGRANHAGTTPMHLRRDAIAGAAEWIGAVEREAHRVPGLVATVGRIDARPGAGGALRRVQGEGTFGESRHRAQSIKDQGRH